MRTVRKFFIIFLSMSCLTGCWSMMEINDRTFVTGIYVDQGEKPDQIELTIMSSLSNRISSSAVSSNMSIQPSYAAISKTGRTIAEAIEKIQTDLTRTVSWGHTRIIVVGNQFAKSGLQPLLEWVNRQPSFHLNTFILVAPKKAKDIVKMLTPVYEQSPSDILLKFAKGQTVLGTTVRDIAKGSLNNQDVAITTLTTGKGSLLSEKGGWTGTDGAALFHENRMVGTVNKTEAQMLAWVKESLIHPAFSVYLEKKKNPISVSIDDIESNIRPYRKGKSIVYKIKLVGEANLLSAETNLNVMDPRVIHEIEMKLQQVFRQRLLSALKKSQQSQADILQLGSYLDWWHPKEWEKNRSNWGYVYQNQVKFDILPKIKIKNFGYETNSIWNFNQRR